MGAFGGIVAAPALNDDLGLGEAPAQDGQIGHHVDDVGLLEPPIGSDHKALASKLVDEVEHAELSSVMGPSFDKIVGPDMVRALWHRAAGQ